MYLHIPTKTNHFLASIPPPSFLHVALRCWRLVAGVRSGNSAGAQIIHDELESSHSNPTYTTCRSHTTKHTVLLKPLKIPQMHFGFVNVILFSSYRLVSATHVAIFRVVSAGIQNIFIVCRYHTVVKIIVLVTVTVKC
jgi:hypothetical protein